MARWTPDARNRLAAAALTLYLERGFEETTVAEIAGRAGLTERTFFRHFADKREVLFGGSPTLEASMVRAAEEATGTAVQRVTAALEAAGEYFSHREWPRRRQQVIEANASLMERELIKLERLRLALADALGRGGVPPVQASLAARMGAALFRETFALWLGSPDDLSWTQAVRQVEGHLSELLDGAGAG